MKSKSIKSVKISAGGKYRNKNVCQQQFVKAILGYSSKIAKFKVKCCENQAKIV